MEKGIEFSGTKNNPHNSGKCYTIFYKLYIIHTFAGMMLFIKTISKGKLLNEFSKKENIQKTVFILE